MAYKDPIKKKKNAHDYHIRTWVIRKKHHYELQKKRKKELAIWFLNLKSNLKCFDCPESDPVCLDFDHNDPKEKEIDISSMVTTGYGKDHILREINKCTVRCKNCHAKRHFKERKLAQ